MGADSEATETREDDATREDDGADAMDAAPEGEKRHAMARVKLYRLNERGHWDDKGTGFASCEYMEVRTNDGDARRRRD
jgi:hypothetical protein